GIGLIALLTLFPLGALRMMQAIQDDRCASAVRNADAIATMKNVRNDPLVRSPLWFSKIDVFKDIPVGVSRLAADPNGPSYPVLVDPLGVQNSLAGAAQHWVCGNTPYKGLIARCPVSFVNNTTDAYKWFTLLDDCQFSSDELATGGRALTFPPSTGIRRDTRYSWAYLVQRPRSSDSSIATCSVVVFDKRPLSLSTKLALAESAYSANFDPTTNRITVSWGNASPPSVRTGDWILDCTLVTTTGQHGSAHGYFYRVVGIAEGVNEQGAPVLQYEVQQPIRGFSAPAAGTIMVLEGIADVYDRGLDRKFD
ncbi:MAG TPA: hypothetical protein VGX76_05325, partial [Pirellulales bacterium]|nr:hypothetical protein [Pirellulales bacterium]